MKVNNRDIYQVGRHIIACGDCTDRFFVSQVVNGAKIRAVIADVPYGIAYVENKKEIANLGKEKVIIGDHIQSEYEYAQFTKKWTEAVIPHLDTYNTFHIFNSDTMFLALRTGMQMANIHFSQMLVWIKNQPVMGMKDYLSQFEVIAYGWYKRHKMERSKAKSLLYYPKPAKSKLHPTQKPVGLLRKIIPNVTEIGDIVYDGFLGSGTTAVASEHLGRKCIGIELDPEYVEVALTRLEKLTKEKRIKLN